MENESTFIDLTPLLERVKNVTLFDTNEDNELASILSSCCFEFGSTITEQAVTAGLSNYSRDFLNTHSKEEAYSNFKKTFPGICVNLLQKEKYPARSYVTMLINWKVKEFNSSVEDTKANLMKLVKGLEEMDVSQKEIIVFLKSKIEPLLKKQDVLKTVGIEVQKMLKQQALCK